MFFKPKEDTRLLLGASVIFLKAGVVRELHGFAAKEAQKADVPTTEDTDVDDGPNKGEINSENVTKLVEAMTLILEAGDESLLTTEKTPRHAEVKKLVDVKFTKDEFEVAWDLVEG